MLCLPGVTAGKHSYILYKKQGKQLCDKCYLNIRKLWLVFANLLQILITRLANYPIVFS